MESQEKGAQVSDIKACLLKRMTQQKREKLMMQNGNDYFKNKVLKKMREGMIVLNTKDTSSTISQGKVGDIHICR